MPSDLEHDLERLVKSTVASQCETQTLEVKAAAQGAPRVYDSLSSFSNQSEGGIILFGIDERSSFTVCGVYDAQDLMKRVHGQCEAMTPQVRPVFGTAVIDGKTVVAAYISGRPMGERPVYQTVRGIADGSFTRIGDADVRMTATELYDIESFKNGRRDDIDTSPDATMSMLDQRRTTRFIANAAQERPLLARRTDGEILTLTGAVRAGKPTLAGMITLGDYPQQLYPNLCITAIAVNGTRLHDGGDERFLDNKRYEGTVRDMLEGALGFVARNSKTRVVIRDGHRTDVPEYPPTAVREIILNALMHRDYGPYCIGTPIRLTLFSDRLECWNPGGIYGGQGINELGYANMPTRNPTLVSLLEIERVAENRHSGIPIIRDEAASSGLRMPEFMDRNGSFRVRFFNVAADAEDAATSVAPTSGGTRNGPVSPAQAVRRQRHDPGKARQDIVQYCSTPRSAQDIANQFGFDLAYLRRAYLRPLIQNGVLRLTLPDKPRSKFQRYVAAEVR